MEWVGKRGSRVELDVEKMRKGWRRLAKAIALAVAIALPLAGLTIGVICRARNARAVRNHAGSARRYVIWQVKGKGPHVFRCKGIPGCVAKRFRAPGSGRLLRGAFYVTDVAFPAGTEAEVSVCRDSGGQLGLISRSRLWATRVTLGVPTLLVKQGPTHVGLGSLPRIGARVPFSIPCKVQKGTYYWLLIGHADHQRWPENDERWDWPIWFEVGAAGPPCPDTIEAGSAQLEYRPLCSRLRDLFMPDGLHGFAYSYVPTEVPDHDLDAELELLK